MSQVILGNGLAAWTAALATAAVACALLYGVRRLVLGSDAEQVVRTASVPVLLVRE